jgi:hypothetical protein
VAVVLTIVAGCALVAPAPARAAKKTTSTLYLHGNSQSGEYDGVDWVASDARMLLDATAPTEPAPKSMDYSFPFGNPGCTGNPLFFPTWFGYLHGTVVGDGKLTAYFAGGPATATARIWFDVPLFSCNEGYVKPNSEVTVTVPPGGGPVTIKFPKLKAHVSDTVLLELLDNNPNDAGRVLYDSTTTPSSLKLTCIPDKGSTCTD